MSSLHEAVGSAPSRLGPYTIIDALGEGGMGVVYRARHVETGEEVAVKTVSVPYGSRLASLRCEIHALTRIRHRGVVRLVGEGIEGGLPWYAMELLEGQTLDRFIYDLWRGITVVAPPPGPPPDASTITDAATPASGRPLGEPSPAPRFDAPAVTSTIGFAATAPPIAGPSPPAGPRPKAAAGRLPEVLTLIRRLCAPLTFIHGSGIVHRDLKPGNVFIRTDGTLVLMDFGLVSDLRGAVGREVVAVTAHLQGTLSYISPEQIQLGLVDARSDLYSLGCILYECVTGRCPFVGGGYYELISRHVYENVSPPSRWVDGVPEALDALILRLLAKEPRHRIGHADDVAAVLAELGAEVGEPDARGGAAPGTRLRAHLYRSELYGREETLAAVLARLPDAVGPNRGGLVLLNGESGVGKTTLATAVARDATVRGLQVVPGECIPVATPDSGAGDVRSGPLHPFRPLFQVVADRCREGGRAATDRILGQRGKILAPFEPSLRQLPGQEKYPDPPEVPAQAERRRILDALWETIAAFAAERPLLLIIDDLQWADELSLSFIESLAKGLFGDATADPGLLVLGTYRSEEASPALTALGEGGAARVLHLALGRLGEATLGNIVGEMLAMAAPPRGFIRALARRSEGNPFFVAEYLRACVDEGLLYREHGTWRLAGGDDSEAAYEALPLPRSLRDLVGRRLDGLAADARSLVEVAAVLGREIDGEVLVATAAIDQATALIAITELLARQVFEEVRPGRFRFFHDKLREIASENTAPERRRALHGAAARVLEQRSAGTEDLGLIYAELAHHFAEAEEITQALDYLEKAGEQAERRFANQEVVRVFSEALALDEKAGRPVPAARRAAWERRLGKAYLGLGILVESQKHLHEAVALLGSPMPRTGTGLALGFAGQVLTQVGHRLRLPRFDRSSPARRGLLREAARAYDLLMPVTYFVTGNLLRILYATLRNLNLAESGGPSAELALAYANAQVTTGLIPWVSLAEAYGRRMHETLEGIDDPAVRSWCYVLAGSYACGIGAEDRAIDFGARAQAIGEEVGFPRRIEEGLGVQGASHNLAGNFRRGRDISHALWRSALRGDPQTQVWGASGEAQNCLVLGEPARALAAIERAQLCLAQDLGRPEKIICHGVLSLTALRNGDRARARAAAEEALVAIAAGTPIAFYCITAYSCVAEACLDLWAEAVAERRPAGERASLALLARRACHEVGRSAKVFPVHRARALFLRGRLEALRGRSGAARRLWQRAAAAAQRSKLPYDGALIDEALALQLPPHEARRRKLLVGARDVFTACEAAYDVARIDASLTSRSG